MYSIKPLGINIKDNDRNVTDGFLQESINVQWRDNSLKPIPNRLLTGVDISGYSRIIFHRVGDEGQVNVLGFKSNITSVFLAFDIAEYLAATDEFGGLLTWFGSIVDGEFVARSELTYDIPLTPGTSFVILNGIMYLMGDGSSEIERYYKRMQYNESSGYYEIKDMYAWKSLIPFLPKQGVIDVTFPYNTSCATTFAGIIAFRYALTLKTGEVVLPSPIYFSKIYAVNIPGGDVATGGTLMNIHAVIPLNLDFEDETLLAEEVSSINVYAATPVYVTEIDSTYDTGATGNYIGDPGASLGDLQSYAQKAADSPFYEVTAIESPSDKKLVLYAGDAPVGMGFSDDSEFNLINMSTLAAGEVMPVDNFSYHRLYGKLSAWNSQLIVSKPVTVLAGGHMRALAVNSSPTLTPACREGYLIDTEDGRILGIPQDIEDVVLDITANAILGFDIESRGVLSYPDSRAYQVGVTEDDDIEGVLHGMSLRKSLIHNLAVSNDFVLGLPDQITSATDDGTNHIISINYDVEVQYLSLSGLSQGVAGASDYYRAENRFQFSLAGEYSLWPALYSYRVPEAIVTLGSNILDPRNADLTAPLLVGTEGGVYTVNFDPRGEFLVASITPSARTPFLSDKTLSVDSALIYVSDKGLMATEGGQKPVNLTFDFFPENGGGGYPVNDTVYPNYNTLTDDFFGGNNPYILDDIRTYMKDAIFAYDAARENIWCCNSGYGFSLVFNLKVRMWTMSTFVFTEVIDYYGFFKNGTEYIYSRFMVRDTSGRLVLLSGEDLDTEVEFHLLTRPIKFQQIGNYKTLSRLLVRCILIRGTSAGYFSLGLWGRQDINKKKKALAMAAKKDSRSATWLNSVRNDIPVNTKKGKYKAVSVLLSGKSLPSSDIDSFDFDVFLVDNKKIR